MAIIKFEAEYEDHDDFLILHVKPAEDSAISCRPGECKSLIEWTAVDLVGHKGELELSPGKYFYRYKAGNTAGNKVSLTISQEGNTPLNPKITIGSGNATTGCNIFRVWRD